MPFNRNNPCTLCQAPKITGFKGISPGRTSSLNPTLTAARTDARENFPTGSMKKLDSRADFGISGRWYFNNNMNLSAAINPDFSQVEADVARLISTSNLPFTIQKKGPFSLKAGISLKHRWNLFIAGLLLTHDWGVKVWVKAGKTSSGLSQLRIR
jgi:hypothetical protein